MSHVPLLGDSKGSGMVAAFMAAGLLLAELVMSSLLLKK